jgi:hypothetical protein
MKDKGYDDSLIEEIVAIIKDRNDGRDITGEDFNKIQSAIKDHAYYDNDDVYFEEVQDYCSWNMDSWERKELLDTLGVSDNDTDEIHEMLSEVGIGSLDDEYRMQLLLKMYKSSCSITDLERMIRASELDKLNNVVL